MIVTLSEEEVAFLHWLCVHGSVAPDDADDATTWRKRCKSTVKDDVFTVWTGEATKGETAFLSRAIGEVKRLQAGHSEGFSKLRANVKLWVEQQKASGA